MFKNKLFLQFLAAGGRDIATGGKTGELSSATKNLIAAQNFVELLKGNKATAGSKITMDDKGLKIQVPKETGTAPDLGPDFQPGFQSMQEVGAAAPAAQPAGSTSRLSGLAEILGAFNPFGSSQLDLSASDLAGLTPEMISSALQLRAGITDLGQRRLIDVANLIMKSEEFEAELPYRRALTDESLQRAIESKARVEEGKPIMTLPGTDIGLTREEVVKLLTTKTEDERTEAIKNFQFAKSKEGGEFKGSFQEFSNPLTTTDWENYNLAGGREGTGKSFDKWLTEQHKSKAIKITTAEKIEEKKAFADLEGQFYFKNPRWVDDVNRYIESIGPSLFLSNDKLAKSKAIVGYIESKIAAGGGKIVPSTDNPEGVKFDKDGRTMVWSVEWPSGDKETIRHAVR